MKRTSSTRYLFTCEVQKICGTLSTLLSIFKSQDKCLAPGARPLRDDFLTTERFFGDDGAVACSSVVSLTASLFCSFGGLPSPSLAIPVEIEDDCCSLTCKSLVSGIIIMFTRNSADLEQSVENATL